VYIFLLLFLSLSVYDIISEFILDVLNIYFG